RGGDVRQARVHAGDGARRVRADRAVAGGGDRGGAAGGGGGGVRRRHRPEPRGRRLRRLVPRVHDGPSGGGVPRGVGGRGAVQRVRDAVLRLGGRPGAGHVAGELGHTPVDPRGF